ncbi:hypothetical protein [Lutispora thermophila]|uniref:Uncharacterized protein n=1 Tax=Lutispora thermophila DSM 19022 TaxID=1122184 RepID=A0A1M6AZ76_9FIRM|nr:hypothetical protein [Lutispora thermophila]SHI41785.1 hypothetical protein SAMN02745176_00193 [Lutispora thermophila DSM 19022]
MKKRRYMPVAYTIIVFIIIFSFHTYQNLKVITSSTSEKWARSMYIDKSPYKKQASVAINEDAIWILIAKEDRFTRTAIDKHKAVISEAHDILIPRSQLNKLVKYQGIGPYIFWTENFELYMSKEQADGSYEEKSLISENVMDFNVIEYDGQNFIAVACDMGLMYYRIDQQGLVQLGNTYAIEKPLYVSTAIDDSGIFHTVAIRQISPMLKEVVYLHFFDNQWLLKAQKVENAQISNESVGNLEIGLDNDYAYIFYENNVWNNAGQTAKTLYATLPLNANDQIEMKFKPLKPMGRESQNDEYVSEVRCPGIQQNQLTAVFIEDYYDEAGSGFRILNVSFKDGVITSQLPVTKTMDFIKEINIAKVEEDEALVFLRPAGEFKYDIWFTESGEEYASVLEKPTKEDYLTAMAESVSPFISGIILAMIKAFEFLPAILWVVIVEFFEIKKFTSKPKLNYLIAMAIYMIIKLATTNSYYRGLAYYKMPDFMKPVIIKYSIMIMISAVAYLLVRSWKKNIADFHIISEFLLFAAYDILITVFLYGPYII